MEIIKNIHETRHINSAKIKYKEFWVCTNCFASMRIERNLNESQKLNPV